MRVVSFKEATLDPLHTTSRTYVKLGNEGKFYPF